MDHQEVAMDPLEADTNHQTEPPLDLSKMGQQNEEATLRGLQAEVRNQDDLERDIGREADRLLFEQANQRDQQRLEKTTSQKNKLLAQIQASRNDLSKPIGTSRRAKLRVEIERMQGQADDLDVDISEITERMKDRGQEVETLDNSNVATSTRLPSETQRQFLIRTGKITPFSKFGLSTHGERSETLKGALLDAEEEPEAHDMEVYESGVNKMSHRNLHRPGFSQQFADQSETESDFVESERPTKRQRRGTDVNIDDHEDSIGQVDTDASVKAEELSQVEEEESDEMPETEPRRRSKASRRRSVVDDDGLEDLRGVDDGNQSVYRTRLQRWATRRSKARQLAQSKTSADADNERHPDLDEAADVSSEMYLPHPEITDTEFDGGYRIPGDIYPNLFDYQKTGVQWLYELFTQQVGGIVGDEMGLGKTIQIIAFLAGLHYSKRLTKPIIVVCPATVMKQWVNEFHRWWPPFQVTILHSSGSGMINVHSESTREDSLLDQMWDPNSRNMPLTKAQKAARKILAPILNEGGVLVTTYSGLQSYAPLLIPVDWQYAILDEGHKIRNPNTAITIYCKELRTPNRIILSGTPMQNNLIELWSLFDFVFPMRLGTLVSFRNQFEIPIKQGGYANATNLQVQTAFKCAETLKDAISPYLLQRFKIDVAADLPKKSEQVLFCKLTALQRSDYQNFLASGDFDAIMSGRRQILYGVDILRKICNHPDLQNHRHPFETARIRLWQACKIWEDASRWLVDRAVEGDGSQSASVCAAQNHA